MKNILITIFCLPAIAWSAGRENSICGKILKLQGDVEVLRLKDSSDVRIGLKGHEQMPLQCEDILLTGRSSRVKIKLGQTLISMSSQTRFSIEEHNAKTQEPNLIYLLYGKLRALVKPRTPEEKNLKVTTPTAVIGVRGTDLFINFDPNTRLTHQATLEGQVEVEQKVSGQKVVVEPGQQVKVEALPTTDPTSTDSKTSEPPPALKVEPISPQLVVQIRQTSLIAKDDKEFASRQAISILGEPENWLPPDDELPLDLRGIKNEF